MWWVPFCSVCFCRLEWRRQRGNHRNYERISRSSKRKRMRVRWKENRAGKVKPRTFFGCEGVFSHFFGRTHFFHPSNVWVKSYVLQQPWKKGAAKSAKFFPLLAFLFTHTSIEKFPRSQANIYFSYYKCIHVLVYVLVSTHTSFGWKVTIIIGWKKCQLFSERRERKKRWIQQKRTHSDDSETKNILNLKWMKIFFSSIFCASIAAFSGVGFVFTTIFYGEMTKEKKSYNAWYNNRRSKLTIYFASFFVLRFWTSFHLFHSLQIYFCTLHSRYSFVFPGISSCQTELRAPNKIIVYKCRCVFAWIIVLAAVITTALVRTLNKNTKLKPKPKKEKWKKRTYISGNNKSFRVFITCTVYLVISLV